MNGWYGHQRKCDIWRSVVLVDVVDPVKPGNLCVKGQFAQNHAEWRLQLH